MVDDMQSAYCPCGHDRALHDAHGCAAFLGAFESTAHVKRYCACPEPRRRTLSAVPDFAPSVVAEIRVVERRGSAIGVCEFPPAIELGASAASVLAAMKARLVEVIAPAGDRIPQAVRIRHDDARGSRVRVEQLR